MPAYNPPVNGVAYVIYISLQDMANPGSYKASPTIAAGDFQVSIDGGAFANLATLPTVTPAAGRAVKISLSAGEMTGDNIFVQCVDQTNPKEWADYSFDIQTAAGDAFARLGAPAGASIAADIAAAKADTVSIKTKTDSLTFTVAGMVDSNVVDWKGATAPAMTGDSFARLGAPAGASVSADIAAVKAQTATINADTDDIQARLPAALVGGRMDSSVGAMAANVMTAAAAAADFGAEVADSVWDEALAGHAAAGSAGAALSAAGSAGDPWATALPGAYGAGTAGAIVGGNLDAAITTRASASALATVQADTDNIQTRLPAALVGGRMDSDVGNMQADTVNASAVAATAVTEIQTGLATAGNQTTINNNVLAVGTAVAAVQADTDDIQTRLPAALVGGRMDASVGAVAANAITAASVAADVSAEMADRLLGRSIQGGADGGRTVTDALRPSRNKSEIVAGVLTVYAEDDSTPAWTAAVTTAAGNPITAIDPA